MQSYNARHASFSPAPRSKSSSRATQAALKWPHPTSFLATPTSLAAAGFYFNPSDTTPDAVSCFICDKGLADWDPHDDPAQIHAEKCPKCPWAMLKCVNDFNDHGSIIFSTSSRLPSSRTMEKARLATFGPEGERWWPHDAKNKGPTSKMMAKAGFIYSPVTDKDDTCTCIYCGIELSGWEPEDDPMEEHRSRQAKTGPCPFFAGHKSSSTAPKRARSKSKPPTTPAVSSSDEEYRPLRSKSSRNVSSAKRPGSNSERTKSSAKSSKTTAKAKIPASEVVAEYDIALNEDQHAPNSRSKSRRASSRSSSRASTRGTSTAESESATSSTRKAHSLRPTPARDLAESAPERTKAKKKPKPIVKSQKSGEDVQDIRDQRQELSSDSQLDSSKVKSNEFYQRVLAPMPTIRLDSRSSQIAEDEDLAREEQALEDQARELMLGDPTLKAMPASSDRGKTHTNRHPPQENSLQESLHIPQKIPGQPIAQMSVADSGSDTFLTLSTPHLHVAPTAGVTHSLGSESLRPFPQELVASMTVKERAMTVEQWVRHEMDRQYEQLKSDGRQKIDAFKLRAIEVAKRIEGL